MLVDEVPLRKIDGNRIGTAIERDKDARHADLAAVEADNGRLAGVLGGGQHAVLVDGSAGGVVAPDLPWQPPLLQPALVRIGTISRAKSRGRNSSPCSICTGSFSRFGPKATSITVRPVAMGWMMPSGLTVATLAFALRYCTERVTS